MRPNGLSGFTLTEKSAVNMRVIVAGCLLLCAYISIVVSFRCGHENDPTPCYAHLNCSLVDEVVGCEHETCTCVPAPPTTAPPMSCNAKDDCITGGMTCMKGGHHPQPYDPSCLNNVCVCLEHPPHK